MIRQLTVPDANTEKDFLTNALAVWLRAHDKPVPSQDDLNHHISYHPETYENDMLTLEDENVSNDGA